MKIKKRQHNTTLDILSSALHKSYMAHICGNGQILPIEERVGKKLLKTIDPMSKKGKELIAKQKVTFLLPDGDRIPFPSLPQIFLKLRETTLEKMRKFSKEKQQEEHVHAVMEHISYWEKFYLS